MRTLFGRCRLFKLANVFAGQAVGEASIHGRLRECEPEPERASRIGRQPPVGIVCPRHRQECSRLARSDRGRQHPRRSIPSSFYLVGSIDQRGQTRVLTECDIRIERHGFRVSPLGGQTDVVQRVFCGRIRAKPLGVCAQAARLGMREQQQIDVAVITNRSPADSDGITCASNQLRDQRRYSAAWQRRVVNTMRECSTQTECGIGVAGVGGHLELGAHGVEWSLGHTSDRFLCRVRRGTGARFGTGRRRLSSRWHMRAPSEQHG